MSNAFDAMFASPEAVPADPVDAESIAQPEAVTEAAPEAPTDQPAPSSEQPRDEHGRFAPKVEGEAQAEAAPQSPPPPPSEVPTGALRAERQARQRAEQQAAELQRQLQQYQQPAPDLYETPEAYAEHMEQQAQAARDEGYNAGLERHLNLSLSLANKAHGEETVGAAVQWLKDQQTTNPGLISGFQSADHPFDFAVAQHRKATVMDSLASRLAENPALLDRFAELLANPAAPAPAPINPAPATQPQAVTPQPPPTPPRSIAGITSAAGAHHVANGPGSAYGGMFNKG